MHMQEFNEKQLYIMNKALELFVDIGFHKSSVRAIANAANVNVAMIFYYFGSKEKLLEAIFVNHVQYAEHFWLEFRSAQHEDPLSNLLACVESFLDMAFSSRVFFRLMVRQSVLLEQDESYVSKIRQIKSGVEDYVIENVNAGIANGSFQADADPLFLKQVLTGSYFQSLIIEDELGCGKPNPTVLAKEKLVEKNTLSKNLKFIFKAYLTYGIK